MPQSSTQWFKTAVAVSFVLAYFGWQAPQVRMGLDFHSMLWWSLPLAGLWLITFMIAAYRFRRKALWLLIGAPLALYWPVWLVINGIPECYWLGNCV
jgi:hypothetical protein